MMSPKEEQVFAVVKARVCEVLVDIDPERVTPERSLVELGANSIDRVEIAALSIDALGVSVPRVDLHGVTDLRGLVEILSRHWDGA